MRLPSPAWILVALAVTMFGTANAAEKGDRLEFGNARVKRTLSFDGQVWRTTAFSRADGSDSLAVESDEFHLLFLDDGELTISDYVVKGEPVRTTRDDGEFLTIHYVPKKDAKLPAHAPRGISIGYSHDGSPWLRKRLFLAMEEGAAIDRLEVERFSTGEPASRGGRGQPVFIGNWFAGLEYPAGHSRHSDGNTPEPDSSHFEMVGNYSYIDLEGRDADKNPRPGLVRLFHFPGQAKPEKSGTHAVRSKDAVVGTGTPGISTEFAFGDYLAAIEKKPRVFLHYNNWFDPNGKNLRGDAFVNVWRGFKKILEPAGIEMHAMVPDNGWQNRSSVWQPSPGHFPKGMDDLATLGRRLREEGTSLGLWNSVDNTTNNIGWGVGQGFDKAVANKYFSRYFAHHCLADEDYLAALEKQMRALTERGQIGYFKHDFNHLCCLAEGHDHLATDRHGHEANVDGMIRILAACRDVNPAIYQNLTNWMWFSPWWLAHGDALWMLAGDDGFNKNWPDISMRAMGSTDRDVFIWRMWGKPADRPLVPISRLMTHGIVKNHRGQMQGPGDTLADWADYVLMHYGRGTQMKEWYITPAAMAAEEWKVLTSIHKWSERRFGALKNAAYVGGRPDEGQAYGYIGWDGDLGVLVARNTAAAEQVLELPFDAITGFRGEKGKSFKANCVYPYHGDWPAALTSGETMKITLPSYATVALELSPGKSAEPAAELSPIVAKTEITASRITSTIEIPDQEMGRCELLVIGRPNLPSIRVGDGVKANRSTVGAINKFAGYARHGMPSDKARPWAMAGYDLRAHRGEDIVVEASRDEGEGAVEIWLVCDRPTGADATIAGAPFPVGNGHRRQSLAIAETTVLKPTPPEPVTAAQLKTARKAWLTGKAFGVNGGQYGAKEILLNGEPVGALPVCGDGWKAFRIELDSIPTLKNTIEIRHPDTSDSYKLGDLQLHLELAGGGTAKSQKGEVLTSVADWTLREGKVFPSATSSGELPLNFPSE